MPDISLIIPTYGRFDDLDRFLSSITKQTHPLQRIEVLVMDQNDVIDLLPLINKYSGILNIVHKKLDVKGSANAKNVGIKLSKAPLITFPDDDCVFYEDTIECAIRFFKENPLVKVVYGRVYERRTNKNIMRQWPDKSLVLDIYNFHLNYSAITCFSTVKDVQYEVNFGTGAYYPSGDELGYVIDAVKKYKVAFTNTIDIWHAELNVSVMPEKKIYNYAIGYGAILKKKASFPISFLFFKSTLNQLLLVTKYSVLFNKKKVKKHYAALKGRLTGFFNYNKEL